MSRIEMSSVHLVAVQIRRESHATAPSTEQQEPSQPNRDQFTQEQKPPQTLYDQFTQEQEELTQSIRDHFAKEQQEVNNLCEMLKEAREQAEKRKSSLKLSKRSSNYGEAAMEAYARLGRARNATQVSAASGYARRRIAQFKAELRQEGCDSTRIRAAIRQLEKAIKRAGKKKQELNRERLVELRRRQAAQREQRRKEMELRQELNRRRTLRSIREHGYLRETDIENRMEDHMAQTRLELQEQAQALSAAISPEYAAQQYAAQMPVAEAAPAPEISVEV